MKSHSRVRLFVTPWTAAYQAPPSMGFSKQEYWSGVPLPSPEYTGKHFQKCEPTELLEQSVALFQNARLLQALYMSYFRTNGSIKTDINGIWTKSLILIWLRTSFLFCGKQCSLFCKLWFLSKPQFYPHKPNSNRTHFF